MRRERTPRDDDEDEPDVSLRDRMTRLDGELVEAREVLERVAPGEPRVQAPATVAEAFALADAAQAAKAKENKHKKGQGDDKAKEKDVPAWWRYLDPFFREVHAQDLHAVLPPRRWDDDPDLRLPPLGRKHDKPFEDGLPKPPTPKVVPLAPVAPKPEPPPPASVSVGVPGVSTIVGPSIPLGPAIPLGMPPAVPPGGAVSPAFPPGALPLGVSAHAPATNPVPAPPSGAAVGGDLLSLLAPDEVAALFLQRVAFEDAEARLAATEAAARACACEVEHLEAWLGEGKKNEKDKGKHERRETINDGEGVREEGDVAAGLRRWLRDDAAEAALAARDARAAAAVPVALATLPDPYARRHPFPPPKVCAVIKSDADGVVYVAGEKPGAPGSTPPPIGTAGLAPPPAGAVAMAGAPTAGLAAAAAAAGAAHTRAGSSERRSPSVSGLAASPSSGSLRGDAEFLGAGGAGVGGPGPSGLGPGAGKSNDPAAPAPSTPAPLTEEEKASLELCRRAFGVRGDLPHAFGSARLDETALPLHTSMLFDRHFWLAKAVGALPSATPQTPWISPSPASRAREAAAAAAAEAADAKGEAGKKGASAGAGGGPGGRCAVCVVQKKGRCGTETAPARCLRRGGRGRADALEDPFDDAGEPSDEPFHTADAAVKAESEVKAEGGKAGPSAAPAPARRPPPTPLPAASTAAIASMRAAERRQKRRAAAAAKREAREKGDAVSSDASGASSSSSSESESESEPASAASELANLRAALDADPALRAAAPRDEVEGETLALQYELMWQQQANRHVITSLLGRVLDKADEEGERFAETEGELAEAAAYMSKVREVRRILKREKRDADQRLALERAAAAAAASSRVGAQRRDADGNVIAPAHGAEGMPEDVAAAAAAAAAQNAGFGRALGVGPGGSPKTAAAAAAAAAAHAARYGMYHARSSSGNRPRIPKHVQDRFAGGVRIGSANALKLGVPGGDAGGVSGGVSGNPPGTLPGGALVAGGAARPVGPGPGSLPGGPLADGVFPGVPTAAPAVSPAPASSFSPSRFGPPEVLVDTIHATAVNAEARAAPRGSGASAKKEKPSTETGIDLECAVCAGTAETSKCQETLRCSRCALPTHPRCYGVKSVAAGLAACAGKEKEKGAEKRAEHPKGWLCWVCRDACDRGKANTPAVAAAAATTPAGAPRPSLEEKLAMFRGVSCVLCPVQLGAFKQCADGRWCHVACAQWMPEISVDESDVCRAIRGVQQIPRERARHPCVACGRAGGVSMRCSFGHCQVSFHPLCARRAGYHVRASDGHKTNHRAYCDKHSPAAAERDRARGVVGPAMPIALGSGSTGFVPGRTRLEAAGAKDAPFGDGGKTAPRNAFPGFDAFSGTSRGTPAFPTATPLGAVASTSQTVPSASAAPLRAAALASESTESLEATASALRRARLELVKTRALCRAVLRRETVKHAVARADAAVARARFGIAEPPDDAVATTPIDATRALAGNASRPSGADGLLPGATRGEIKHPRDPPSSSPASSSPAGPSGVTPVAPKRARSRATRGKPRSTPPSSHAPQDRHRDRDRDPGTERDDERDDERSRAKRARRSGSGGSVLRDAGTGDVSSHNPGGWSFL